MSNGKMTRGWPHLHFKDACKKNMDVEWWVDVERWEDIYQWSLTLETRFKATAVVKKRRLDADRKRTRWKENNAVKSGESVFTFVSVETVIPVWASTVITDAADSWSLKAEECHTRVLMYASIFNLYILFSLFFVAVWLIHISVCVYFYICKC